MKFRSALFFAATLIFGAVACHADEFSSDGVKIHYVVKGAGDPVILIHGLFSSEWINWEMPGLVEELAQKHQVIAFDCRGHGLSDKPQQEHQYGVQMAEDVVRLMDHLHIAKAHVVGYSMGGMITMKLLTLHPERVSSAVLGGMGWLQQGSPLQGFWSLIKRPEHEHPGQGVPVACLRGLGDLAVTEAAVKAVKVPVDIVVGDRDPCRQLYVEPLRKVRPDWPEHIVLGAGHIICIVKPEFKAEVAAALDRKSNAVK